MATLIRFLSNFYAVDGGGTSYVKYQAGSTYPVDEETLRLVESGIAQTVEVPDSPLEAPVDPEATSTESAPPDPSPDA